MGFFVWLSVAVLFARSTLAANPCPHTHSCALPHECSGLPANAPCHASSPCDSASCNTISGTISNVELGSTHSGNCVHVVGTVTGDVKGTSGADCIIIEGNVQGSVLGNGFLLPTFILKKKNFKKKKNY